MDYEKFIRDLTTPETKEPPTMLAKQSVYLSGDRSKAVPEGHEDARFLLVREGHEVNEAEAEKYDGAMSLVTQESKAKPEPRAAIPAPNFKKFGKEAEKEEQKETPDAPKKSAAKKPRAKKAAK